MTRIAILDDYLGLARAAADWDSLGPDCAIEVFEHRLPDEGAVADALAGFEVVIAMRERTPFPRSLLERLPALKLLVTTGMRNLAIDVAAARELGITVCGTRMTPYAAFEHAWALILALAKRTPAEDRAMREGDWHRGAGVGLNGKRLGILGLGKLGAKVARVANAFEMDVVAWSEHLTEERCRECGARLVTRDELFATADFVTIHLVLGERTRGLVDAAALALMKPTAYLVNTSRGPIVDEAALVAALTERRIAGAAIDVYDVEPLPADHPLRALDNALLTGHTGYVIEEMYTLAYGDALEDVRMWLGGEPQRVLEPPA